MGLSLSAGRNVFLTINLRGEDKKTGNRRAALPVIYNPGAETGWPPLGSELRAGSGDPDGESRTQLKRAPGVALIP
jgi:hypothetical protein